MSICYVCGAPRGRLFPGGSYCSDHMPKQPEPDPARTLDTLRAKAGTAPFVGTHTAIDDRAEKSGRRVPAAKRAAIRGDA